MKIYRQRLMSGTRIIVLGSVTLLLCSCTSQQQNASQMHHEQIRSIKQQKNILDMSKISAKTRAWHYTSSVKESKPLEDEISGMGGIQTADVMVSGDKAYVAVIRHGAADTPETMNHPSSWRNANQVPNGTKQDIIDRVTSAVSKINHVYISADPKFVSRMMYVKELIRQNKSASTYIPVFYQSVCQQFPLQP